MARSGRGNPEMGGDRKRDREIDREVREGRQAVRDTREDRQDKGFLQSVGERLAITGDSPGALVALPGVGLGSSLTKLINRVTGLEPREPDDRFRQPSRDSDNNRAGRQLEAAPQAPAPAPAPVTPLPHIIVPGDPANVGLRGRRRRRLLGADETGLFRTPILLGRR
ncbi:MAG: hypothetical protein ACTS3R_07770 [Inquilinaceae bacterium]